jgi:hypothetical protein
MTDQQIIDLFSLILHGSEDALDQAREKVRQAQQELLDAEPPQASTDA